MVQYEDMTPEERDRFIYLVLGEKGLQAIVWIMHKRHGKAVTTEQIMRFAFKVASKKMVPAHLKASRAGEKKPPHPKGRRKDGK